MRPAPLPGILDIKPYVGGESSAPATRLVRLASNEGAFGPSPRAVAAYRAGAEDLHRYPDGDSAALRQAIGRRHGLDPDRIVCGNGSDELISALIKAYAGPGDEVLHTAHGFLMYALSARVAGATPVAAPERSLRADVDALLAHVSHRTRLVFLANPNNPTGTHLTPDEVARLHAGLPAGVLLVIDAAYAEYIDRNDYTAGSELVERTENVVMTRTFSKIHALAGLRIGWLYGPPHLIDVLNRVRGPFNVNAPAQAAGIAAMEDWDFVERNRDHNAAARDRTMAALGTLGLTVHPSIANFLLVDFAGQDGCDAESARLFLKNRGILVRQMGAYGLPTCLRVSIGTDEEMDITVEAVGDYLNGAGQ